MKNKESLAISLAILASAWLIPNETHAEGCVAARCDSLILHSKTEDKKEDDDDDDEEPKRWQFSLGWRWQYSQEHYIGAVQQVQRDIKGSQVKNNINILGLGLAYDLTDMWTLSLEVPFEMNRRDSPVTDSNGNVLSRYQNSASGIGDTNIILYRWLFDPKTSENGNVRLGVGIKLPTGQDNVEDQKTKLVNGQFVQTVVPVDQSIQLGDGGYGLLGELQAFQTIVGPVSGYFSGRYLLNPMDTNGVLTFRSNPFENVMSIPDQYVARLGLSYDLTSVVEGLNISNGLRIEGVPVKDLVGASDGFRRPGYAVSVEPRIGYATGPHEVSLAVPVAVYRYRSRSLADIATGTWGDAAFADYLILFNYSVRY